MKYDLQKMALAFHKSRTAEDYTKLYWPTREYFAKFLNKNWIRVPDEIKEECIDNSLTAIWEKMHQYDEKKAIYRSWATQILVNSIRGTMRVQRHRFKPESYFRDDWFVKKAEAGVDPSLQPHEDYHDPAVYAELEPFILKLPDEVRDITWDKYITKLSYIQMAEKYNMHKSTLKTRVRKGVKLMTAMDKKEL